ncbi:MAG: TonB-dependent receptor [Sulfuricaulis sp.]|nr:TonB-dependent receptor [Sulfuricaulis sp.]
MAVKILFANTFLSLCAGSVSARVQAGDDVLRLDEIVVSGTRPHTTLLRNPRSATVITRQDIERSAATNLLQLLSRETGLQERSASGNDKNAFVDLRGQGDTAVSNVIVLVDGVRLNPPDLAGPDLSSLTLSNIERIEILRGPEAVRYGGGAVGGAINIITRAAGSETARLAAETGSFDSKSYEVEVGHQTEKTGYSFLAATADTEGHRKNSYLYRRDARFKLSHDSNNLRLSLEASAHDDEYGLPGAVSAEAFATQAGRESSTTPFDHGETEERRLRATLEAGEKEKPLHLTLSTRHRENPYYLGFDPARPRQDQLGQIKERARETNLDYRFTIGSEPLAPDITIGANLFQDDYESLRNGVAVPDQSRITEGHIENSAAYLLADIPLSEMVELSVGARRDLFDLNRSVQAYKRQCETKFVKFGGVDIPVLANCNNVWVSQMESRDRWRNSAWDAGIVATITDSMTVFLDYATSFRNPNVDELALPAPDLHPQQGRHAETGLRWHPQAPLEVSIAVFHAQGEDEIYFDGATNLNRNYTEKTLRTGLEFGLRARLHEAFSMRFDASALNPRFAGSGETIPLVARTKASAGGDWHASARWLVHLDLTRVGSRPDGNDVAGVEFPELAPYTVANLRATWSRQHVKCFVGVTNLADEVYATSAYSGSLYPMPGRAFQAGVSITH